jgi:hypothetical protein
MTEGRAVPEKPLRAAGLTSVLLAVAVLWGPAPSGAVEAVKLRKAVIPLFTKGSQPVLAAVITIDRAAAEPRRLGFFKIPACPKFVVDHLRLSIRRQDALSDILTEMSGQLRSMSGSLPWEIRHLEITAGDPEACRLEARRASLDPLSIVPALLLDEVRCPGRNLAAARARLLIDSRPGDLKLVLDRADCEAEYHLFSKLIPKP